MARDAASCAGTADPLVAFGECGGERGLVLDGKRDRHIVVLRQLAGVATMRSLTCFPP